MSLVFARQADGRARARQAIEDVAAMFAVAHREFGERSSYAGIDDASMVGRLPARIRNGTALANPLGGSYT